MKHRNGGADLTRRALLLSALAAGAGGPLVRASSAWAEGGALHIPHAYGEAVLPAPARRVVSLGYNTHDALLALGVVPVGLRFWYGPYADGVWPWAREALGDARPTVMIGEVSMETVAALNPDLIVGIGSGITQEEYAVLSQIAPVLMQAPDVPTWGASWQDVMQVLGRATGTEKRADDLVSALKARFASVQARHPSWSGATAVAAWHDGGQTGAFTGADTRAGFLRDLGFRPTAGLEALETIDGFYTMLSPEDLSPIDADLLIWISSVERAPDLVGLAMRRTTRAWREGREVFADELLSGALSFASILSLPFALDTLEAEIALALDGDPATVVPSAQAAGLAP